MTNEELIQGEVDRVAKLIYFQGKPVTNEQLLKWVRIKREKGNLFHKLAKQILFGGNLYLKVGEELDNEYWHKNDREYEAYQAGKNDVRAAIIPLKEASNES